jgi:hypothetical protein
MTATSLDVSSIPSPSAHKVRQMVYEARFERMTMSNPLEPPKVLLNDDCIDRFSTILQASKQAYDKAGPVLYSSPKRLFQVLPLPSVAEQI